MPNSNNELAPKWKALSRFAFHFVFSYAILFVASLPFPQPLLPDIGFYLAPFFESIAQGVGILILGYPLSFSADISSDSIGLCIHSIVLFFIAATIAFCWTLLTKPGTAPSKLHSFAHSAASYYLSMQLMRYGFDKVFKHQFFIPEPNTLYTPLGQLEPDILFWTAMGSSYSYSVFSGLIELLPAFLLLFKPTRVFGALVSFAVLFNVWMINLGFGISVKIYSFFLLALSLAILAPYARQLLQFFFLSKESKKLIPFEPFIKGRSYLPLKTAVILLLLANALLPYIQSGNFNDDTYPRPMLHGAYELNLFILDGDTILVSEQNTWRWKRIFIHRRGYFIFQNQVDEFKDFELKQDYAKQIFYLKDYDNSLSEFSYTYNNTDSILLLKGQLKGHEIAVEAKRLEWRKLPFFLEQRTRSKE